MEKLRAGELQAAVRFNRIALQKNPHHEKALIVKDVLAMRRDALLMDLMQHIEQERAAMHKIEKTLTFISRQLSHFKSRILVFKISAWLFLFVNIFIYLSSYFYLTVRHNPIIGSVLGGLAVVSSVVVYFLFQFMRDRDIQSILKKNELMSAQKSMTQELAMRKKRLRTLHSQLSQTRYQLMVK